MMGIINSIFGGDLDKTKIMKCIANSSWDVKIMLYLMSTSTRL